MSSINWNETYTNISPKLLGICRRYIKDMATAEDIVQDSFIVAIQKENTLKDPMALNGWLSRIVINMAIHHLKETKKINFSTTDNYDWVDNATLMNTLELDNKSRLLASDIDRNDILEAIDRLPEHHKSVFNMYVMDQFSHIEIAKTLSISVGTSKSNLSRARKAIQTFLFEKLNLKNVDEKKKRRIAILLFFGFGNSLFANFYQSKFQDFEVVAKKPFSFVPKKVAVPNQFVGLSKAVSIAKMALLGFGFFVLIGFGFYFFKTHNSTKNEVVIENNYPSILPKTDSIKTETATLKTVSKKQVANKIIPNEKENSSFQKSISFSDKTAITNVKKDSTKTETPKIVVVKKQIIKRDTIYVTK